MKLTINMKKGNKKLKLQQVKTFPPFFLLGTLFLALSTLSTHFFFTKKIALFSSLLAFVFSKMASLLLIFSMVIYSQLGVHGCCA